MYIYLRDPGTACSAAVFKVITEASKTLEATDPCSFTLLLQLVILQLGKLKPRERVGLPRTHRKLPFKGAIYLRTKLWSQKERVLILGVSLPSCDLVEPNSNRRAHTGGSRGEDVCKALTTCLASW